MNVSETADRAPVNGSGGAAGISGPTAICIPDHQLVRCIGRGSYGEVWLARNSIGTYRAVKVLRRECFPDQRPFERELSGIRKFEPISRSHEGFVDILQVGINDPDGYFYYVMELGYDESSHAQFCPEEYKPKTLARELARRRRLPLQECLHLGLHLADALASLHRHGLVHRDIKPSNIIFVGGTPKLADIGLVTAVDEARSYVGTEGFIPPEGPGTPQADIYSLGKLLYESSTGKDRQDFPELPTHFDKEESRSFLELNEILLRACHGDCSKRYQSAEAMHAELQVLAAGNSVRRLRLLERRFSRLKRAATLALMVAAATALLLFPVYREWQNRIEARQRQVGASIAYGTRAVESGDFGGALPYFAQALELDRANPEAEAQHSLRFGSTLAQAARLTRMCFATQQVVEVEFSLNGGQIFFVENYGRAQVRDAETGTALASVGQRAFLWGGSLNPKATEAVVAGEDNAARVWRLNDGTEHLSLNHPDKVYSARFSPDGRWIITGCRDKIARIWNAETGELQIVLAGHDDAILFAGFSPDTLRVVTTSKDSTARLWNAADGHSLGPPLRHSSWVYYASFGPGNELVTACFDHQARLWDLDTYREILPRLQHEDGVKSAEFSPDGRLILTSCLDGTARLWECRTHLPWPKSPLLHHSSRVTHARFAPDGHRIVTACIDGTVRIWDLAGAEPNEPPFRAVLSPDGSTCLVAETNGFRARATLAWRAPSDEKARGQSQERQEETDTALPAMPLIPLDTAHTRAFLSENGKFILTFAEPGLIKGALPTQLWDARTAKPIGLPVLVTNRTTQFGTTPDGKISVMLSGNAVLVWNTSEGSLLWAKQMSGPSGGLVLDQDSKRVAAWAGYEARVWEVPTGREIFPPLKHALPVKCVTFSPDRKRLATCTADDGFTACSAQIWDAVSGRRLGPPLPHDDGVLRASFSPDGSRLATAGEDFTARLWDVETGRLLTAPLRHKGQVLTVSFSPDGKWLLTGASDGSGRVWSAETGDPLTPPFTQINPMVDARFLGQGATIVTWDAQHTARVFKLAIDHRSIQNAAAIASLLSGGNVLTSRDAPLPQAPLQELWKRLCASASADFLVTPQQLVAWHRSQARESEHEQNSRAAIFHLRELCRLNPTDSSLQARLSALLQDAQEQ